MKKFLLPVMVMALTLTFIACSKTSGGASSGGGIDGVYTGKMKLEKINESYILGYRSQKEKDNLKSRPNEETRKAAESLLQSTRKTTLDGVKNSAKEGTLTINIWKNVKSKSVADGDYMLATIAYNRLIPTSNDPYWASFKDKRNGDISVKVDTKELHLSNSVVDDKTGATYMYKVDGNFQGGKLKGTWSQSWDATEVYSGSFELDKMQAKLEEK